MSKCKVSLTKQNVVKVSFNLTEGEFISLVNALRIARKVSPVAQDVSCYVRSALHEMPSNTNKGQEWMDMLNKEINVDVCPGGSQQ